jgi:hypothetical protein
MTSAQTALQKAEALRTIVSSENDLEREAPMEPAFLRPIVF